MKIQTFLILEFLTSHRVLQRLSSFSLHIQFGPEEIYEGFVCASEISVPVEHSGI